jgi:transcriptional regulator with XRE-family HTH domain
MTQNREWVGAVHERIAGAIKATRDTKNMSAQQLADETKRLGYPISRSQIANYESGRKQSLDVAELLVIAAALDTAPVCLVFPGPYRDNVRIFPESVDFPELLAAQWFCGLAWAISDLPFNDEAPVMRVSRDIDAYERNLQRLRLAREQLELQERRNTLWRKLRLGDISNQPDNAYRAGLVDAIADLETRIQKMDAKIDSETTE